MFGRRGSIAFVALALLTSQVAALEPVSVLEQVRYVRTVDGGTVVVLDPEDSELTIGLLGVEAPPLEDGNARAFAAAGRIAKWLTRAKAVYLELDDEYPEDQDGRILAWVWYDTAVQTGETTRELLNVRLVEEGLVDLYEGQTSERYRTELAQAAGVVATESVVAAGTPCPLALGSEVDPDNPVTWVKIEPAKTLQGSDILGLTWGNYGEFYFDITNLVDKSPEEVIVCVDFADAAGNVARHYYGSRRYLEPGQTKRVAVGVWNDEIEDLPKWMY